VLKTTTVQTRTKIVLNTTTVQTRTTKCSKQQQYKHAPK
jgi:hypothetical protein